MKSKKRLKEDLEVVGARWVGDETFGKKSMVYVRWASGIAKAAGEKSLAALGHVVHRYSSERTSEVQVNYFKGWHWDE